FKRRPPALVLEILRRTAKHGIGIDLATGAKPRAVKHRDVADQLDIVTKHHICRHMAEWSDAHATAELSTLVDNRTGMDQRHAAPVFCSSGVIRAEITASATFVPSTMASQANFQMPLRCFNFVTCSSSLSPGTTGLRNLAESMVMK